MYEDHFSFKCKPFELIPNPDFLFLSSTHKKAITYIDYGIKEKIGFILLTGEIGSGKTTIVRNLIKNLNGSVRLSRINNTKILSEELVSMINEDFGLEVDGKSKIKLLSELNEFLIDAYSNNHQPVLLIDEAQNLSPDLLEEIRLLSNLETDKAKLLQIILVGQPELKKNLMLPEMMQLRQRINISYHISPLSIDETAQYIKHRLSLAGNSDAIELKDNMLYAIWHFSRGIPRLINILCDFALLAAFTEGKKAVSDDIVKEVIKDIESRNYWSETQETEVHKNAQKEDESALRETAGNIALRLISLEETLQSSLYEIKSLSDKLKSVESWISQTKGAEENERINELMQRMEDKLAFRILIKIAEDNKTPELLDRISRLEEMTTAVNKENTDIYLSTSKGNHSSPTLDEFAEQIKELIETVSYLKKKVIDA